MENATATCFFCSREIAAGTSAAFVTVEGEPSERVYHLSCFENSTTGSRHDRDIWTYRIVDMPKKAER